MADEWSRRVRYDVDMSEDFDTVDRPKHYNTHSSGVEAIEIAEILGFNVGNACKYLWRAGSKGSLAEDVRKAEWYLRREAKRIAEQNHQRVRPLVEYVFDKSSQTAYRLDDANARIEKFFLVLSYEKKTRLGDLLRLVLVGYGSHDVVDLAERLKSSVSVE